MRPHIWFADGWWLCSHTKCGIAGMGRTQLEAYNAFYALGNARP